MTDTSAAHVAGLLRATPPVSPPGDPAIAREVLESTCRLFAVTDRVLRISRSQRAVKARQVAMTALRAHTTLSLPGIAKIFGCNHTTVLHSIERVLGDDELRGWAAAVDADVTALASFAPRAGTSRRSCRHRDHARGDA